jgi:hypothetical protein
VLAGEIGGEQAARCQQTHQTIGKALVPAFG